MRTIALVNQKGGCGKTTTAVNLSYCLKEMGKRVLLVDCDPQSHASMGMGMDTDNLQVSTYDLFMNPETSIQQAAVSMEEGLDVTPSNVILSAVEQQLSGGDDREKRLSQKFDACDNTYDYILVDCPPNVGLLTFNAIVACNEILVVMEPSVYSFHGALKAIETIRMVRDQLKKNKKLKLMITLFDKRTKFNKNFLDESKNQFHQGLMETVIGATVRFKEAARMGQPIVKFDRSCKGAKDYMRLAKEVAAQEEFIRMDDFDLVAGFEEKEAGAITTEWIFSHPGPQITDQGVLFSITAPMAKEVKIVGDFNNWGEEGPIRLKKRGMMLWAEVLDLTPGLHFYKFIVDGKWTPDPANKNRVQPNDDCVVNVPAKQAVSYDEGQA